MRVAINQPYFIPYAGFFRLFAMSDIFVIYDDAQFPKEGWVNRNCLTRHDGEKDWLTLPLKHQPLSTKIKDIAFAAEAKENWKANCRKFPVFSTNNYFASRLKNFSFEQPPSRLLLYSLSYVLRALGLHRKIVFSSQMNLPVELKGQDKVIAICRALEATHYVNAPGGIDLYDFETFEKNKIRLQILKPYEGSKSSILERLVYERPIKIRKEIDDNAQFIP
jgi:hypothetical protein